MADLGQPTPQWRMVLCKFGDFQNAPANATKIGEIVGARERVFSFNLNKPSMITFKQDLTAPQATTLLAQKEGWILLYRNNTLVMTTDITSVEANGQEGEHSIAVTATESMWPRLQGKLLAYGGGPWKVLGPTAATDQGTWLISTQLAALNAMYTHSTILGGSVTASGNITGGIWYFKPFMELMQELAASTSGFDFWQTPLDPSVTNSGVLQATGSLNIAPLKGSTKSNVVFEFGTGRANALSYKYLIDNSNIATDVFVPPSEWPNSAGLSTGNYSYNYTNRGHKQAVVQTDIQSNALRFALADATATVRSKPREQFFIQPAQDDGTGRVPQFWVDYTTGDIIRGRVLDQGVLFLDANVRVYGVSVAVGDEGQEIPTLTLVNEA